MCVPKARSAGFFYGNSLANQIHSNKAISLKELDMKYMLVSAALALLLNIENATAQSSKIYTWVDENGVTVYSDKPKPGAKELTLSTPIIGMQAQQARKEAVKPKADDKAAKVSVRINSPKNEATIRDNNGELVVTGRVEPKLPDGAKVKLLLNGTQYGKSQASTVFRLSNIERGEHHAQLVVIDKNGTEIAQSDAITFYLHKVSVIKAN
jgi:hypothetical protein